MSTAEMRNVATDLPGCSQGITRVNSSRKEADKRRQAPALPARTIAQRSWETLEDAAKQIEEERLARFSMADLESEQVRLELLESHPMLEDLYFIDTSAAGDFYEVVFDHAFTRRSGLYVDGGYRVGKTTAIKKAIDRLAADIPRLGVLFHSARRDAGQSRQGLFSSMLASFRYPVSRHQVASEVITRFIMATAARVGSRTCLVFIDEAQMLTVQHFRYLLELWNELRQDGFLLVTILVGQTSEDKQPGIDSLRQLHDQEDHGPVVARFFVKRYTLGGIHSLAELREFMKAYDEKLQYPPESNWTYSRFFRKDAYDKGWRLAKEAPTLWAALLQHTATKRTAARLKTFGFRTGFVTRAIHGFLIDGMGETPAKNKEPEDDPWLTAVEDAGEADLFI